MNKPPGLSRPVTGGKNSHTSEHICRNKFSDFRDRQPIGLLTVKNDPPEYLSTEHKNATQISRLVEYFPVRADGMKTLSLAFRWES